MPEPGYPILGAEKASFTDYETQCSKRKIKRSKFSKKCFWLTLNRHIGFCLNSSFLNQPD